MTYPSVIGIAGVAGAGKDTTFERLAALGGERFVRFSIADPMKESIAALFDLPLERLDELKRDPDSYVKVGGRGLKSLLTDAYMNRLDRKLSMREFMQRYGTESHRDVFGEDFWLRHWLRQVEAMRYGPAADPSRRPTIVNTSVRFANEAEAIIAQPGGEVWLVEGPQDDGAGGHPSEEPLPDLLVTRRIDNTFRPSVGQADWGYENIDDQLALILDEWRRS